MADRYTAWDGKEYAWPPPDGWQQRTDGRYWPEATAPTPPAPPSPIPTPPAPVPPAAPHVGPQPFGGPSPTVQPPGSGGTNTGLVVFLVIIAVIVLVAGSCILALSRFTRTASDAIQELNELGEEYAANQEEARAEVTITETGCSVIDGVPTATVRIANRSGGRSDYSVTITFTDESGRRLLDGFGDVDSVQDGEDVVLDIESPDRGVTGSISCGKGTVNRRASIGG